MKVIRAVNIENSTISVSSENPLYDFDTALNDSRLSRYGKTVDVNDEWIKFTYAAAIDVDVVGIFENNFMPGATVKIQANATDVWISPSIDQALTYTKDDKASIDLGRDVGIWSYQFSSTESYKYWRLSVDDPTNPDGYIKIGFIFTDESLDMPGMSVNQTFPIVSNSTVMFSTSGQAYGLKKLQINTASFNFPVITTAQKKEMEVFYYNTDLINPYMILVWENSLDVQRPLYAVTTKLPEFYRVEVSGGVAWTCSKEIREVK